MSKKLYVVTCDGDVSCVFKKRKRARNFVRRRRDPNPPPGGLNLSRKDWKIEKTYCNK